MKKYVKVEIEGMANDLFKLLHPKTRMRKKYGFQWLLYVCKGLQGIDYKPKSRYEEKLIKKWAIKAAQMSHRLGGINVQNDLRRNEEQESN